MKVLYNNKEINLDDRIIKEREEFDELKELEDTIELNINDINNYGDMNE